MTANSVFSVLFNIKTEIVKSRHFTKAEKMAHVRNDCFMCIFTALKSVPHYSESLVIAVACVVKKYAISILLALFRV